MKATLLFLMVPFLVFSQVKMDINQLIKNEVQKESNKTINYKNIVINDSSIVMGYVSKTTLIRTGFTSCCFPDSEKNALYAGDSVIISGFTSCKKCSSDEKMCFYEIIHKDKNYFIEKNELICDADYYVQLEKMPWSKYVNFQRNARNYSSNKHIEKINKLKVIINSYKNKGLTLLYYNDYDTSDYVDGTNLTFKVYNPTNKTIKYLSFVVVGYNSVNDVVVDPIKKKSIISVRGVGPIKPKEFGDYDFDYVWHTDLVENVKITQIYITYMDGSSITIKNVNTIMPKLSFEDIDLFIAVRTFS